MFVLLTFSKSTHNPTTKLSRHKRELGTAGRAGPRTRAGGEGFRKEPAHASSIESLGNAGRKLQPPPTEEPEYVLRKWYRGPAPLSMKKYRRYIANPQALYYYPDRVFTLQKTFDATRKHILRPTQPQLVLLGNCLGRRRVKM